MRPSWCPFIVEPRSKPMLIVERDPMWLDRYSAVCRECPDLVAVSEAPAGPPELFLRQTLVPLPEEFSSLRRTTRRTARAAADKLRAAGFRGGFMVLPWAAPGMP